MGREKDLEKIRSLVALAADLRTPRHEAETAAILACRKLASSRLLETLEDEAGSGHRTGSRGAPKEPGIRIQGPLLVLGEAPLWWRLALLEPGWREVGSTDVGRIPKEHVLHVAWADDALKKRYGVKSRLMDYILVEQAWVHATRRGYP